MNETELFQVALGLLPPWKVERCTFDQTRGRLDIHLDFPRGSLFPCNSSAPYLKGAGTSRMATRRNL